jgi:Golgi apparatus protein 1
LSLPCAAPKKEAPKPKEPRVLGGECRVLADIAEPPNVKRAFDASLSFALIQQQLETVESSTGLELLTRNKLGVAQGVSLTGWTALAGIAAMVVLTAAGGWYGYKRYKGVPDHDYTLVVKTQPK